MKPVRNEIIDLRESMMDDMQQLAELTTVVPFGAQAMQEYPATAGGYNPAGAGRSNWTTNEDTKG